MKNLINHIKPAIASNNPEDLFFLRAFDLRYIVSNTLRKATKEELFELWEVLQTANNEIPKFSGGKNLGNAYNAIGRHLTAENKDMSLIYAERSILKHGTPLITLLQNVECELLYKNGLRVFLNGNLYKESKEYLNSIRWGLQLKIDKKI